MGTRGAGSGGTRTLGEIFIDLILVQFFLLVVNCYWFYSPKPPYPQRATRSFSYRFASGVFAVSK